MKKLEDIPVYWTPDDFEKIEKSRNYKDLTDVALGVLHRMPRPILEVCGPISHGGYMNLEKNLYVFKETIRILDLMGKNVFNQMPFQKKMQVLKEKSGLSREESNKELLNRFYLPIFKSGMISEMYFINGWKSSSGARWENRMAKELGMEVNYLPEDLVIL